ncbi:MAG: T9SS type A sorting domain-containing protein [Chitinophagaceae bacterium]|nr:T9SS type A sorting domain-containing protein [Chitinophagaceae bacterium]
MRKVIFTLISLLAFNNFAQAQAWIYDTISIAPGYGQDVFYSMENDSIKNESNTNWHLAFSLNGYDSAAVWANHGGGNNFVKVYNIHKTITDWNNITIADTATGEPLFNGDFSWHQGAFNFNANPSPFNFGWGTYNTTTHQFAGDSVFLIKAGGTFYKLSIDSLNPFTYKWDFRIGLFDSSNTTTAYSITKSPTYDNRNFAYFNIATGTALNREPSNTDWDLLFTRYNTFTSLGGPVQPYNVTGALSNRGVQTARAQTIHVDTAFENYSTHISPWFSGNPLSISTVGWEWKNFNMSVPPGVWEIPDSNTYFVKNKSNKIYQLQFLNFGGSATGQIALRKRFVIDITKINEINSNLSEAVFFPNPTQHNLNFACSAKENADAKIVIYDLTGKMIYSNPVTLNQGLNSFVLPTNTFSNGNYIAQLVGKNMMFSSKFVINK